MKTKMILFLGTIAIAFNTLAQSPKAYVTNYGEDYISVIDILQKRKISDIKTGMKPHGVAISPASDEASAGRPDGKTIAVSNEGDNTVSIIDGAQNKVVKTIPVGKNPHQLDFTKDGKYIMVAINGEHRVDVISTATWKVEHQIPVGRNPHIVLPMPDGKTVWATSEGDNKITKIDLKKMKVVAEIPVFGFPRVMTATPDGKFIFLTIRWLHGVVKVDTEQNKIVNWIQLPVTEKFNNEGKAAHGLAVSPDGKNVYLTSQFTNDVSVIDIKTSKITNTIHTGDNPNWIDITPDGKYAVVSNTSSHDADIIDLATGKSIAKIEIGKNPKRLKVGVAVD